MIKYGLKYSKKIFLEIYIITFIMTVKTIDDLIEPDSENEKKFNLSIKQLNFIQNDNNIKFMNNIIKLTKQYKLEVEDINNIIDKYIQNELKKQERNEARKLKKQQEKNINNDSDEDDIKSIISNKSSNKNNSRSKKEAIQEKDKMLVLK